MTNTLYQGDCEQVLKDIPSGSVHLIMTSPPYGNKRKHTYGGINPEHYVSWWQNKQEQFARVLHPKGSLIVNIKEGACDRQRQLYVYDLVIAMVRHWQWLWIDDLVWHKKTCYPGKYPCRLKDGWEHCYHFTRQKDINFYHNQVLIPAAESTLLRARNLSERDKQRIESTTGSPMGMNRSQMCGKTEERRLRGTGSNFGTKDDQIALKCMENSKIAETITPMALPSNVLYLSPEGTNKKHSAAYPETLPSFFIKLLTKENDIVLDPFVGSGTTMVAANKLNRNSIGIDFNIEIAKERCKNTQDGGIPSCVPQ